MAAGVNARVTFVFQDTGNDIGWTETYFAGIPAGAPAGWQETILTGLQPFITARLGAMLNSGQLDFVKISDDGFRGDMVTFNTGATKGTYTANAQDFPGPLDAALLLTGDITGKYRGRKFMHAFPLSNFFGRVWKPGPSGLTAFNNLSAALVASGLTLRVSQKPPTIPPTIIYPAIQIVGIIRLTGHRVGRPFDYLRGRRRIA